MAYQSTLPPAPERRGLGQSEAEHSKADCPCARATRAVALAVPKQHPDLIINTAIAAAAVKAAQQINSGRGRLGIKATERRLCQALAAKHGQNVEHRIAWQSNRRGRATGGRATEGRATGGRVAGGRPKKQCNWRQTNWREQCNWTQSNWREQCNCIPERTVYSARAARGPTE